MDRIAGTYEINTDGRDIAFGVGVIGKSEKKARLSDARITDKQELEEVVVSVFPCQSSSHAELSASLLSREALYAVRSANQTLDRLRWREGSIPLWGDHLDVCERRSSTAKKLS